MSKQDKRTMKLGVSVLVAALAALPICAEAAGLGKLTVLSALGQPLRAELDVSASREELNSLAARVAGAEAFRQANIEYTGGLSSLKFTLDKRANGQPYFRLSSDRAIGDPFIDMLVELSWSSGRLVREYTFLLDPPEMKSAETPVAQTNAPAVVKSDADRFAGSTKSPKVEKTTAVPVEKLHKAKSDLPVGGSGGSGDQSRVVRSGDTLAKIASETKPDGVSLDQMLVALFRGNEDAFSGGNMNRLRAGKILAIPDKDAIASVEVVEAHKVVVAQAADFNAYKRKLAGAAASSPAKDAVPAQSAAGKITPKVEDKTAASPATDKLEVSKTEAGKTGASAKAVEDAVAKEKALKEAQTRINELEKNLSDMRKLSELKSQSGADLQKQGKPVAPESASNAQPSGPAKSVEEVAKPVEAPSQREAPAVTPVAPPPVAAVKKALPPPPPPPEEPEFFEENGLLVAGGGAVFALLAGFFGFKAWKRRKATASDASVESVLGGSSVFSATDSASSDAGAAGPSTDFGLSGVEGLESEGVDPIREADTYMAYGRDAQAEEILLDARKKDPSHIAVYLKLLEIYAARRSVAQFNEIAGELHAQTGGFGAEWEQAEALGRVIDPSNPLYGAVVEAFEPVPETAPITPADVVAVEDPSSKTIIMQAPVAVSTEPAEASQEELPGSLDFDLDLGSATAAVSPSAPPLAEEAHASESGNVIDFDFEMDVGADIGSVPEATESSALGAPTDSVDIDFDLGPGESDAAAVPSLPTEATPLAGNEISFDLDLGETVAETASVALLDEQATAPALDFDFDIGDTALPGASNTAEVASPALDLSAISLDLDTSVASSGGNPEVATKLELAQAYEEMGDKEGARELLNEVLAEGDAAQQAAAREKLAVLG